MSVAIEPHIPVFDKSPAEGGPAARSCGTDLLVTPMARQTSTSAQLQDDDHDPQAR